MDKGRVVKSKIKNQKSKICIIGVGLIGGSLGKALVKQGKWHVVGLGRRVSRLKKAKSQKCIHDHTTDLAKGVLNASIVILAVPVKDIVSLAKKIRPLLSAGVLVMDVGSVKGAILNQLERVYSDQAGPFFVGVHPMAGSEKTGAAHAQADLFKGSTCVITPYPKTPKAVTKHAHMFWRSVGAVTLCLSGDQHDHWVAMISHLPHVLANAMVITAAQWGNQNLVKQLAAGSFRDMTRVAGADPGQWVNIFQMNAKHVQKAAQMFMKTFNNLNKRQWPFKDLKYARKMNEMYRNNNVISFR